jgi:outer membrane protein TolC
VTLVSITALAVTLGGCALLAQTGPPGVGQPVAAPVARPQTQSAPANTQNPFTGSVPANDSSSTGLSLSLQDAIQRGLKQNLGLIVGDQNTRLARARELQARAQLLPNLTARVADTVEQVNLQAFGFQLPAIPGFPGIPSIVGPFNVFDARAALTQSVVDFTAINNRRAARHSVRAAELTNKDGRDLVVLLVASAYLQVIADQARIDEARAEVETAQALFVRASDQVKAGVAPALDALRAQVELQSEQTRLRQFQNDFAKDKLSLARLIGLPVAQSFQLAERPAYAPMTMDLNTALEGALRGRSDYQAAEEQVRAAELSKRAAVAERYPSIGLNADYGDIGKYPYNSHGTFSITGSVRMTIWEGGRIRGDIEEADAELRQRQAEMADLKERIAFDVRGALLDLETAADQVATATSSADLSRRALTQAQDRFSAGVADNIEVVQAQQAVVSASQTYINSLYAHNLAKVELARAMGMADAGVRQFLGGK